MSVAKFLSVAISLAALALNGRLAEGSGQTVPAEKSVAKLIVQLGADDFRTREQASKELVKLGSKILLELQKAAARSQSLEVKRRIEQVVTRIENALLHAEDKNWQNLDGPRRSIKDRLLRILRRTPALSDRQLVSAVYLITVGRSPSDAEMVRAQNQMKKSSSRFLPAFQFARSLVQSKEFKTDVADASGRLFKLQMEVASETEIVKQLQRLNGAEIQKLTDEVAAALHKAAKGDTEVVDLAYLLVLSRFPEQKNVAIALDHFKKLKNRERAASDLVWSMVNSREFLMTNR